MLESSTHRLESTWNCLNPASDSDASEAETDTVITHTTVVKAAKFGTKNGEYISDEKYFVKILLGIKKSIPIDFLRPLARL